MAAQPEWLTLDPGEELLWSGNPRLRRILGRVVKTVVVSVGAVAAAWVLLTMGPTLLAVPRLPFPDVAVYAVAGLVVLTQLYAVVKAYLVTTNVDYVLTSENLYKKTGVFSEQTTRVGLDRIQNTELQKGFLGTRFDYGTVLVSTAGSSGSDMAITDLDDPQTLRRKLRTRMGEVSAASDDGGPLGDPETRGEAIAEARTLRETADALADRLSEP